MRRIDILMQKTMIRESDKGITTQLLPSTFLLITLTLDALRVSEFSVRTGFIMYRTSVYCGIREKERSVKSRIDEKIYDL